jgi:hypothetical protein
MWALLVGLPAAVVVGVGECPRWLRVVITTTAALVGAPSCCGVVVAHRHGRRDVAGGSTGVRPPGAVGVAQAALALPDVSSELDRARWADRLGALRVDDGPPGGRGCRSADMAAPSPRWAADLDCDWHAVMDAVALCGHR